MHRLALNYQPVRAASFDIECSLARSHIRDEAHQPHVFVTGLARAGTSILLRILYQNGDFACQTYRDMPFILAPQLWRNLSSGWRKPGEARERAHADGMMVDFDTVEAFEEVFWLTFAGDLYLRDRYLMAHDIDAELASRFYDYVSIVIAAENRPEACRYLSKNNNNLLRLSGLARAFPASQIIIPFRSPLQHAASLLRQHRNFSAAQTADPFVRQYMRWLGHFEFGLDCRPFLFGENPDAASIRSGDAQKLQYWVENWNRIYNAVQASAPANAVFWDYDAFCADPAGRITALAEHLRLDIGILRNAVTDIRPLPAYAGTEHVPATVLEEADATHERLRKRAQKILTG